MCVTKNNITKKKIKLKLQNCGVQLTLTRLLKLLFVYKNKKNIYMVR